MIYPALAEVKETVQSGEYGRIPVCYEMLSDEIPPVVALQILRTVSDHCFMLESAEHQQRWGRYTFIGFDPVLGISCRDKVVTIKSSAETRQSTNSPKEEIRAILAQNRAPRNPNLPSFTGGLVGYFAFDYITYDEPTLVLDAPDQEEFQDVDLMLFDKVIAYDHYRQKMMIIINIPTYHIETSYQKAVVELKNVATLLKESTPVAPEPLRLTSEFTALFNKDEYCSMVEKAQHYIHEGDIFQVVLANRFEAQMTGSLFDTYRILRTTNPSPYMFYFASDELEIAGASPETLVKLEHNVVRTYPLAGTRRRGATEEEDLALEAELLADEKELSEHNMLVDLGRNDLGRISKIGSVEVENYLTVERFSHVMHLGTTVAGELAEGKDALDAVSAILPAGTLSGAPKIRACQIINELEHDKRGIYGGAIGYLDFTGNLDTCIAIRIAYARNGKVFVRSGAGIVADSVGEREYQECVDKAGSMMQALHLADGGVS